MKKSQALIEVLKELRTSPEAQKWITEKALALYEENQVLRKQLEALPKRERERISKAVKKDALLKSLASEDIWGISKSHSNVVRLGVEDE